MGTLVATVNGSTLLREKLLDLIADPDPFPWRLEWQMSRHMQIDTSL
jgi:hypothetical protein